MGKSLKLGNINKMVQKEFSIKFKSKFIKGSVITNVKASSKRIARKKLKENLPPLKLKVIEIKEIKKK